MLAEVLKIMHFRRWKGLEFTETKTVYQFEEIPALMQSGWTQEKYQQEKLADERSFEEQCQEIIDFLGQHENSWPFRKSVDREKVRDYYEVIKRPMDLETIQKKVNLGLKEEADSDSKKVNAIPECDEL